MTKAYLDKLNDLMAEIKPDLVSEASLEIKHFFSGAAVFANGKNLYFLFAGRFCAEIVQGPAG